MKMLIKDFVIACIFGPAFFAGYVFQMLREGFTFGRFQCEQELDVRADDYRKQQTSKGQS